MAVVKSIRVVGCGARGRSGELLILRLTPRGTRRPRLLTTRSSRISFSTASCRASLAGGGKCSKQRQLAADNPHRVQKGEPVRVLFVLLCCFVFLSVLCFLRQQQAPELLP